MRIKTITVTSLNKYLGKLVKSNVIFSKLAVEGEVSNIRVSKSGYTYFTLSDENSSINCIYFGKNFEIVDGDKVIVHGRLNIYEARGTCQIVANEIDKVGIGNILIELNKLRKDLEQQGAFDNKKDLPTLPSKIGIVTSHSGAALQDILQTFRNSDGRFDIRVYNALVQGSYASRDIIEGINYFNETDAELILISRGGGGFEDLAVFNDIKIAEAIMKSNLPVITGIGHETDMTIADYVADKSLHTPTAAANFLIQMQEEFLSKLIDQISRSRNIIDFQISDRLVRTNNFYKKLLENNPRNKYQELINEADNLKNRLMCAMNANMKLKIEEIDRYKDRLISYDIDNILKNGFAMVLDEEGKNLLNSHNLEENKNIQIVMKDNIIFAEVKKVLKK